MRGTLGEVMEYNRMSQNWMMRHSGVTTKTIRKYMSETRPNLRKSTWCRIVDALNKYAWIPWEYDD